MDFELSYHLEARPVEAFSSWSKLLQDTEGYKSVKFDLKRNGLPTITKDVARKWLQETPEDIVMLFVAMAGENVVDADEKYTQGDCEVFAAAMQCFIPKGVPIAVYDPVNPETGRKTRGAPYLIHAGVLLDDKVYDIRGAHDVKGWISTWFENGNASEHAQWNTVDLKALMRMQKSKITPDQIEEAKPFAKLITLLCPQITEALILENSSTPRPFG